jgi:hypothetical protein
MLEQGLAQQVYGAQRHDLRCACEQFGKSWPSVARWRKILFRNTYLKEKQNKYATKDEIKDVKINKN